MGSVLVGSDTNKPSESIPEYMCQKAGLPFFQRFWSDK